MQGDDSFSTGDTVTEHYNPIITAITTMPKPVIAAVNGIAAGAGVIHRIRSRLPHPQTVGGVQHGIRRQSHSRVTPVRRGRCRVWSARHAPSTC